MAMSTATREIDVWTVAATAVWVVAVVLLVVDAFISERLTSVAAFGGLAACVATTLSVRCIAHGHLRETCRQMRSAFELGREHERSVRSIR